MDGINYGYDSARSTCAQVLATMAFECLMFNVGIIIGMPVIVIGALRLPGSDFSLTDDEASWFAGLIFIAQPLGSVVSGFLQDQLGRKLCMMVVNIPQLMAWVALHYATSATTLFVSVATMGLSLGFMEAPVLSYIGEISEPRLRGVLSSLGGIFFNFGLVVSAFIGASTDWRTMMLWSALSPILAFLALSLVPDSPAWLVTKGRVKDAEKAFQWLRGWVSPEMVKEELDTLISYVRNSGQASTRVLNLLEYQVVATEEGTTPSHATKSQLEIFLHPSVQRPLRLIVTFFFITSCTSLTAMKPFFVEFLTSLNLPIRPNMVIFLGTGLVFLGAITSTLLMRRVGKRGLTFSSLGLGVVCCFGLGLYLIFNLHVPWLVITLVCLMNFAATLGMLPVPWILISEVFPLKGRGVASGVSAAIGYLLMFIIIKTYFNVVYLIGESGALFLYGTVGLLGIVYLYFNLPETEGVPLQEIEKIFYNEETTDRCDNGKHSAKRENELRSHV
ncbi:facilitated trehalose transporter Tret1-like isoform X2 [Macrosteles quadrilineatus]|uniref:facilitated trehalose transporter Tret1-like isoform X2 n=1 Tax=Macrosteles quadrilineatus TaxID=74068 RepID=UPI0023E2AED9|nr:facilitated trehalose transporter Tret1-like isoform X2 [Macrosteles quadrilineatus]